MTDLFDCVLPETTSSDPIFVYEMTAAVGREQSLQHAPFPPNKPLRLA
jgi:hypothetical protein